MQYLTLCNCHKYHAVCIVKFHVIVMQTNGAVRTIVRKKAALCLLRLLRKSPPDQEIMVPDVWSVKLVSLFRKSYLGRHGAHLGKSNHECRPIWN